MELRLVYRALRKISDLVLLNFYSEVDVQGESNVPKEGPVIIAASHHNEMIDIATLGATIPHRRPLCFWAKSTMFRHPLSRAILTSSGSIPVHRNPNSSTPTNGLSSSSSSAKSLFDSTSVALAKGEVVGVFPEGTSYTETRIMQVKEGAAWAGVEYVRWAKENGFDGEELVVVPVGIVYTDKSKFQSRVSVKYGSPIHIRDYTQAILFEAPESERQEDVRVVVKKLTQEIEKRIVDLTINAPDWDTLYAARITREMLWEQESDLKLRDFVDVSQMLLKFFEFLPNSHPALARAKRSLVKYYSLLHYTNLTHASLSAVLPPTPPISILGPTDDVEVEASESSMLLAKKKSDPIPTARRAFGTLVWTFLGTFLHLKAISFTSPFMTHLPAYICATIGVRLLATPGEEEGIAQYKAVIGGLGRTVGLTVLSFGMASLFRQLAYNFNGPARHVLFAKYLAKVGRWIYGDAPIGWRGKVREVAAMLGIVLAFGHYWPWRHRGLAPGNLMRFGRLKASYKVFRGILSSPSSDLTAEELEPYTRPPPPPPNPFIRRKEDGHQADTADVGGSEHIALPERREGMRPVTSRKLIRHLLLARLDAREALEEYLNEVVSMNAFWKRGLELFQDKGAKLEL